MTLRTEMIWSRRPRGALELEIVGRVVHRLVEPIEDRRVVAVEELEQVGDELVVLLRVIAPTHGAAHFSMWA